MLFNSFVFVGFFLIVYAAYVLLQGRVKPQNFLLLVASYVFYGYWDWRFLLLIAASTLVDFFVGRRMGRLDARVPSDQRHRTFLVRLSVVVNLSLLGFFKYFNFFSEGFADLLGLVGMAADPLTLNIVLPVGISFYTFQTMSYTIDIYRNRMEPTDSFLDFAVFVAFFPQLVAGPIERARALLPQFARPRRITVARVNAGLYLILWGFFKKLVAADGAGVVADIVFDGYMDHHGAAMVVGVLAFAVQIYGDFSGYSDIARGLAYLMGFKLMLNFDQPYFAVDPSDFWKRWHISLSSWLRDYLYIPLGGNRGSEWAVYRNLSLTMLLGGLWHGAAWNFVIWGAFHGAILIIYRFAGGRSRKDGDAATFDSAVEHLARMAVMFTLTLVGWLLFRAQSAHQIAYMLSHASLVFDPESWSLMGRLMLVALPLVIAELVQYRKRDLMWMSKLELPVRVPLYAGILAWMVLFGTAGSREFIYFQF